MVDDASTWGGVGVQESLFYMWPHLRNRDKFTILFVTHEGRQNRSSESLTPLDRKPDSSKYQRVIKGELCLTIKHHLRNPDKIHHFVCHTLRGG